MNSTIEATWSSRYEYGQGLDDTPQTSEHQVKFVQDNHDDSVWVGTGANEAGSELTMTLRQNGNEFKGDWHERTAPTGSYGGREFSGTILLLLQAEGQELRGMWLGANSDHSRVKSGIWTLQRAE